jgi:hypothetical protein
MNRLFDKILGRIEPLEPLEKMCEWKKVANAEVQLEGSLQQCNACDGYNTDCSNYTIKCDTKLKEEYR